MANEFFEKPIFNSRILTPTNIGKLTAVVDLYADWIYS
jgi:hypothetical protein